MWCKSHDSKILLLLLLAVCGILFKSCAPVTEITVEILQPARVTLPVEAEKISFLNQSYQLLNDTVLGYKKPLNKRELLILDTALNNQILSGLIEGMNNSPRFDLGKPEVIVERRTDTTNFLDAIDRIHMYGYREKTGSDLLISLEYYHAKDTTEISINYETYDYEVTVLINTLTVWRIYDLNEISLLDEYVQRDTVYWYESARDLEGLAEGIPSLLGTFREAAHHNGFQYSLRIAPGWFETERFIYHSGNKELRKAGKKALSGNWDGAAEDWEKLLDAEYKTKIRAKAYNNMAVYYEISDEISKALEYANKSYSLRLEKYILEYINILLLRELNNEMLLRQLPPGSESILDPLKDSQ